MAAKIIATDEDVAPGPVVEELFGATGLRILPPGAIHLVVENRPAVIGLGSRCRSTMSRLSVDGGIGVVIVVDAIGVARLRHWLALRIQVAAAVRAILAGGGVVVGQFAVTPGLTRPAIAYELRSGAQRYAEQFLMSRPREDALRRGIRRVVGHWSGCDPAVGAVVIVGRKQR